MPRIARTELLKRLRAKVARGEPIIGGGAGTGLSAKCEEAGGIDLIVIYNSGRYRMAGRGSLAGLLAYGNANEIVCDMAREVLPVVRHTPVLAGVNGTDPFMIPDQFLRRLIDLGFSGVQNFPTAPSALTWKRRAWATAWRWTSSPAQRVPTCSPPPTSSMKTRRVP
jgi:predicted TIM-barrel enzyme